MPSQPFNLAFRPRWLRSASRLICLLDLFVQKSHGSSAFRTTMSRPRLTGAFSPLRSAPSASVLSFGSTIRSLQVSPLAAASNEESSLLLDLRMRSNTLCDSLVEARVLLREQERLIKRLRALHESITRFDREVSKEFDSLLIRDVSRCYFLVRWTAPPDHAWKYHVPSVSVSGRILAVRSRAATLIVSSLLWIEYFDCDQWRTL